MAKRFVLKLYNVRMVIDEDLEDKNLFKGKIAPDPKIETKYVCLGESFGEALSRLVRVAVLRGLISIEDANKFLRVQDRNRFDIEFLSRLGDIEVRSGKHFFVYRKKSD